MKLRKKDVCKRINKKCDCTECFGFLRNLAEDELDLYEAHYTIRSLFMCKTCGKIYGCDVEITDGYEKIEPSFYPIQNN